MKQHEPLARATLDTLPMNIAVLDEDGTILFTNQAWKDYGTDENTAEREFTGTNYFAGIDRTTDSYASRAVDGIQAVMDGEQPLFTLEYPCETPERSQWFLMRVVPLEEGGGKVVVAHIDITDRKQAEIQAQKRARDLQAERQRLEHLLQRMNGLVQDVMESLMEAETRAAVEQSICEQFVAAEPFVSTWVGELDLRSESITPVAWAGSEPVEVSIDRDDEADPTALAATTRELQVVQDVQELPETSIHREICPTARAVAALPLVADDTLYGVLTAYAAEPNAFDERETTILEALGRTVATAINAIERKHILTADELVEVELELTNRTGFVFDLSATLGCRLEYAGSVRDDEADTYTMFFTVEGVEPSAVLEYAADHAEIAAATHVSDFDGRAFVEFEVRDPPIVATLAEFGAETRELTVTDGVATVRLELAADAKVRSIVDSLGEQFDGVELLAYRERERPTQTKQEFVSNLMTELTDRQRAAIQKAFVGGFFEWPRGTAGEELAASMDISPSTYHQHLRAAQRKVFTEIFER